MKKNIIVALICVFSLAFAFADENHYINVFVGDRASGLGGAYTAIADGPEGVFYNPAGIAFSGSQYFSLSVNALQFKMLLYKNVYTKTDGTPFDYFRYSFSMIPNFSGFVQKVKHFTFAFTISCPDSEFYDQRDSVEIWDVLDTYNVKTPLNINHNYKDQNYQVGPAIAFLPNKYVSIGLGAYVKYRDIKVISQTVRNFTDYLDGKLVNFYESTSNYINDKILGLNLQVGVQVMPFDKLSIGYMCSVMFDIVDIRSFQNSSLTGLVTDKTYINYFTQDVTNNTWKVYHLAGNGLFRPMLIKQALGLCFFINKSMLISLDGYLYLNAQNVDSDGHVATYEYNKNTNKYDVTLGQSLYRPTQTVIGNVACGFEWYITPNFPLRLGFFTNFTNTPVLKEWHDGLDVNTQNNYKDQEDYVNMFGGSISFGFSTSDMSINLGAVVQGGVGRAQIIGGVTTVQEVVGLSANVFISSTYQF